jgi:hypothetical protein
MLLVRENKAKLAGKRDYLLEGKSKEGGGDAGWCLYTL